MSLKYNSLSDKEFYSFHMLVKTNGPKSPVILIKKIIKKKKTPTYQNNVC